VRVQEDEKLLEGVVLAHPKEISLEPYTIPVPPYVPSTAPQRLPFLFSPVLCVSCRVCRVVVCRVANEQEGRGGSAQHGQVH
jgi:hypothetical protein